MILVDVDETLCKEVCWTVAQCKRATPVKKVIDKVNRLAVDNKICIYTGRRNNLVSATLEWLDQNHVRWDMFSNKKIPGELYIDTIAVHPKDL